MGTNDILIIRLETEHYIFEQWAIDEIPTENILPILKAGQVNTT